VDAANWQLLARFRFEPDVPVARIGRAVPPWLMLVAWLATLAAREHVARHGRFTCFYGHCDNIVFPPSTAVLEGARNVHIAGTAHVEMADRPEPWDELQRLLAAAPAPLPPSAPAAQTAPTAMPPVAPAPD